MGQNKEVFITRFIVKGTVEQRILGLQISKQHVADAALGDSDGLALGKLGRKELMGLFGDVIRDEQGREKIVRRAPVGGD
jgi:SNF2 family DNA or RNA helicase